MENIKQLLTFNPLTLINNHMNDYTKPEYKNLYKEILKDYNWTWGKFSPIPYPLLRKDLQQSNPRK